MGNRSKTSGRKISAAERLQAILMRLSTDLEMTIPSASALCEQVGISRTTLYRYHDDILGQLRTLRKQRRREPELNRSMLQKLRKENEVLRRQQAKIASLVDHYFAAWQEASSLLQRRDEELASLRKSINVKPLALKR